jgi:hypothetical protein
MRGLLTTNGGGQLNLANLDLIQKRNHILNFALSALPDASRQLLATLALLSESVDYQTLCALNPRLSPFPEEVPRPKKVKQDAAWRKMSDAEQKKVNEDYLAAVRQREEYDLAPAKREEEVRLKAPELALIVKDLERRGLLQYDANSKRYDLHPVVRGISAGGLKNEEKDRYGQRVVDHFSQQAQDPYNQAESLDEFGNARHIVKVLLQMGKKAEAHKFIRKNWTFIQTLNSRFEAHNEILTVIRPFFSDGWNVMPKWLDSRGGIALAKMGSVSLRRIGALQESYELSETALLAALKQSYLVNLCPQLLNIASTVGDQNYLAFEDRLLGYANAFAMKIGSKTDIEMYWLARFRQFSKLGKRQKALSIWADISNGQLSSSTRAVAAHHFAVHLYQCGELTEVELAKAEELNRLEKSALGIRNLCALRGFWYLEQNEFALAKKSLQAAVALAHKAGKVDRRSEICLAIAQYSLSELPEPTHLAAKFSYDLDDSCCHALASLWAAIGDYKQASGYADAAYRWAWADGEQYIRSSEIKKVNTLLKKLGIESPSLPSYDAINGEILLWEADVVAMINIL